MMTLEHRRPLIAFGLVTLLCAFVLVSPRISTPSGPNDLAGGAGMFAGLGELLPPSERLVEPVAGGSLLGQAEERVAEPEPQAATAAEDEPETAPQAAPPVEDGDDGATPDQAVTSGQAITRAPGTAPAPRPQGGPGDGARTSQAGADRQQDRTGGSTDGRRSEPAPTLARGSGPDQSGDEPTASPTTGAERGKSASHAKGPKPGKGKSASHAKGPKPGKGKSASHAKGPKPGKGNSASHAKGPKKAEGNRGGGKGPKKAKGNRGGGKGHGHGRR